MGAYGGWVERKLPQCRFPRITLPEELQVPLALISKVPFLWVTETMGPIIYIMMMVDTI